jgi:hypothetical protein
MKKIFTCLCSVLSLLVVTSCQQKAQKLLLAGSGWNKVVIIDKETKKIEWEHPLQDGWECNSAAATPDGNILFAYRKGAKLITRDHKELWNIAAPDGCEMQTARVLPDGNYLLAWCGHPAKVMEVSPRGEILSETTYETGIEDPHAQFRQVNKNKDGNYLMPLFATSEVREIAPDGKLVQVTKLEGTPFSTVLLDNGNYMVACGDGHSLMEVDLAKSKIIRKIGAKDIEGVSLFFVAQLLPTSNNGLYICNWQGHDPSAKESNNPQLMEIDGNQKVIWSLNDNETFGMISSVCPID